ncbi:hypothetical protein AYY19_08485 [Photobacterium aquimaris]|uniref:glycosyltransferase n=1 Tax=Photobacterium aquimaris TaxID=512643 RepID=UPI0007EF1D60|nr:glycosyltransferase [Photobacterium aquimaris]OBU11940.1 hypothetical protein AYY19_08485 [Photobacterium aquimaris]PSW01974.1 hypothetical protein CTM91_06780 [Photobacterium aquimaris]
MLLSIVIPTKGRTLYVKEVLNLLLSIGLNNTEICIQDNNEIDEISGEYSKEISIGKIKYNHTYQPLSFVDNFEKAIQLATGDYITIIGDDDIVNPNIETVIKEIMMDYEFDVLIPSSRSLFYIWPDTYSLSKSKKLKEGKGLLIKRSFSSKLTRIDNNEEVKSFFKNGCLDYLDTNMPKLYHGIVKRTLIMEIINKYGFIFGGLTPDIYAAVMLSLHAKSVYKIDMPLTIPGACKKSGSAASETGAHTGKYEDAPHLRFRGKYDWSCDVPKIYTVETIWADSALAALRSTDFDVNVNLKNLHLLLSIKYGELYHSVPDDYKITYTDMILYKINYVYKKKTIWYGKKILEKIGLIPTSYIEIEKLENIANIAKSLPVELK